MDKARLDWLEQRGGLLNYTNRGPHVCIDDGRDGHYHVYGGTYREALDNAMREYVPYTPPERPLPNITIYDEAQFIIDHPGYTEECRRVAKALLDGRS